MDGVLLAGAGTPPELYERATAVALAEFGVDPEEAGPALCSQRGLEAFRRECDRLGLDPEAVWTRRERTVTEFENEYIDDGGRTVYDDVAALAGIGGPTGIVSNNTHGTVAHVVDRFGFGVDSYYGREPTLAGYRRRKPDPHYLDRALADVGVAPGEAVYIGDRASDVEAAENAGTDSVLLGRGDTDVTVSGVIPTHRIESLNDLEAVL